MDIVKELVRMRANVDLQDKKGYSALMVAAERGNLELVQVLVVNGSILDLKEKMVRMITVEPHYSEQFSSGMSS